MKLFRIKGLLDNSKVRRWVIFLCTFLVMYSILLTSVITQKYNLSEGEIAKVNIKATREVRDELKTSEKVKELVDAVPLKYSRNMGIKTDSLNDINAFFTKVTQLKEVPGDDKEKAAKLSNYSTLGLHQESYALLISLKSEELAALQKVIITVISEVYDNGIENKPEEIKKAKESMNSKFTSSGKNLNSNIKILGASIVDSTQIKPNNFYDEKLTEEARAEIRKKISPEVIKKDQIIVKEGEPVTKYEVELMKSLGLLNKNSKSQWYIYISLAVLIILVIVLQWFYLFRDHLEVYLDYKKLILINLLSCIAILLARTLSTVPFFIPLAFIPLILSLLINDKVALTVSVLNCILISGAVGFDIQITTLAVVNSIIGAIILRKVQQRNDILYSSVYIAIINVVLTFSLGFLLNNNFRAVIQNAGYSFIASGISAVLTIGFLPLFESTFDIVTTIKLLELANPNNALLKRLLMEAPGTYHHSIIVANLAEVAAEAVGANPVLTRVSAYYHDVGKIKRPYFFKENQMGNDNPHSKITPNLSTLIITSHVKDGVELAKEHKIPTVIRDIIEQHHGTTLVKYFYITAKNSSERPEDIKIEDFRYLGPIPCSKEAGVIMLADSVEAAVRSINEPTNGKIEEMVNNIIKARLNEGQFDNCDLTLKDLDKIRSCFLKVLSGIYHERIEYPVDKWLEKN
jgi:putative nucleotidyltransferase with HDIG domain